MRYAIFYNKSFRYFSEVDEIIFEYSGVGDIVKFVTEKFKENQRAIINVTKIENIENIIPYLNKLSKEHSNFIIQINMFTQKKYIELLKDNNINYMFANFATNLDTFFSMVNLEAKDIYIVEELAFNLKNLQDVRKKYNINFRLIPDVAQSAKGTSYTIPSITKFFIRPEDIEEYEKYIDVIEIYRQDDRQSVIYEIYKKQQWLGQLEDIILDLDVELNNTNIAPHFGRERINCGKRCMFEKCNLCLEIQNLANRFQLTDISIIKKKKKSEISSTEKEEILKSIKKQKDKENNESTINKETV